MASYRLSILGLCALVPSLLAFPSVVSAASAVESDASAVPTASEEPLQIDNRKVRVTAEKEITITPKYGADEDEVSYRELWYSSFDGKDWGAWNAHGAHFPKHTAITWAPSEGYWRIYIRKFHNSGASTPAPTADTKAQNEFIIDRTPPSAAITYPTSSAKLRGGQKYTITWDASDAHLKTTPITLRYSLHGDGKWETLAKEIANSGSYDWQVPLDMTITGQLQILAADKAGNVGIGGVENLLVDSIKPQGHVVGPAISAKTEVPLELDISDKGPAGLSTAQLWVSQDDGTSWNEGPIIPPPFKTITWKAPADGHFRLAVVATDQALNVSALPKGKDEDGQFVLTVDTTPPVVHLTFPIGVVEAAKSTNAQRNAFVPGTRVAIPFTVQDANLQANSATVYIQYGPGKEWIELGKDLPTDAAFRFELPAPKSTTKLARVRVTAVDIAGNVGEAIATEPFEIDTGVIDDNVEVK